MILVNKDFVSCVLTGSSVFGSRVLLASITNWNIGLSFVSRKINVSLKMEIISYYIL